MYKLGFTFIEALFVLLLFSVMLMFAGPMSQGISSQSELNQIKKDIFSAVNFARNQALSDGNPYILNCISKSDDCSGGLNLYKIINAADKEKIYQWLWTPHHWHIKWQGFQGSGSIYISSQPYQRTMNGTFIISSLHDNRKVVLKINRQGRLHQA